MANITSSPPYSEGDRRLPYQRPSEECRTFRSWVIEKVIEDVTSRMSDPDLARLFENTFPSTTDTTIRFHIDDARLGVVDLEAGIPQSEGKWQGPHTFVITGDINAEWLRDSTNQLALYHPLANFDPSLRTMLLGAINTQSEYVIESPYCNAFQPPPVSGLTPTSNGQDDTVHPTYEPSFVFECKYELDSLAHFLALGNRFYENTGSAEFVNPRWVVALETILHVIEEQSLPTFHPVTGQHIRNEYTFQRRTELGTETLNLGGIGNPLNNGTGLVRSAFRPSDDATILGFLVPANAMMAVELRKTGQMLEAENKLGMAKKLFALSQTISDGIWRHAVVKHPKYGEVFAYELDGYGSHILMDDANYPSLLALPLMGFVERNNEVYQNTRRMLLSQSSNPYFLTGRDFHGIGGMSPPACWCTSTQRALTKGKSLWQARTLVSIMLGQ